MARLARIVIPGTPYHVTQRGNRRARKRKIMPKFHLTTRLVFERSKTHVPA
jgi:hypothetical protein